jgi:hypothetical protein
METPLNQKHGLPRPFLSPRPPKKVPEKVVKRGTFSPIFQKQALKEQQKWLWKTDADYLPSIPLPEPSATRSCFLKASLIPS